MASRRIVVGGSALLLAVAIGACGSGQAQRRPKATTTLVSTATTASPTATTAPTTGITDDCPSGLGVAAQGAPQAARCLYEAWKKDDRSSAAVFASLDVVETLFRGRWSPPEGTFEGCSAQAGTGGETCRFDHHGSPYAFNVQRSEGGWRVIHVQEGPGGG